MRTGKGCGSTFGLALLGLLLAALALSSVIEAMPSVNGVSTAPRPSRSSWRDPSRESLRKMGISVGMIGAIRREIWNCRKASSFPAR